MRKRLSPRALTFAALSFIVALAALVAFLSPMHQRFVELADELQTVRTNWDTSTGLRLQIWQAAWHLFLQNPVFGIGPDQFANAAPKLVEEGYLSPLGAAYAKAEVHNEILTRAVTLGMFGLAAALLIYVVPFALFVRAAGSPEEIKRRAGVLGACFVTSFFVFGLSVEIFDLKMTATFYSLTVAVLLAVATNSAAPDNLPAPIDGGGPPSSSR